MEPLLLRDGERQQGNQALRLTWEAGTRASFEVVVAPEDPVIFALAAVPGATPPSEVISELEAGGGASLGTCWATVGRSCPRSPPIW